MASHATGRSLPRIIAAALFFVPYLAIFTLAPALLGKMDLGKIQSEIIPAAGVSATLAIGTGVFALITAVAAVLTLHSISAKTKPWAAFLMGVPSGISALVLGLGLWLAYGRWIDPFEGSATAIIALQTALFFPIAFRILWPILRDREMRLLEAAATLGASPIRAFWWVEWPRWRLPLLSAFGMIVGASLGEVAAVSLFYSEKLIPLPLLVSRWSGQYRFEDAQAVAALLLILCTGAVGISYLLRSVEERISNE